MQIQYCFRALALSFSCAALSPLAHSANDPGGFRAGDMYLYNSSLFGISTGNAGIMHIDAVGSSGQAILGPFGSLNLSAQQIAYDPFRDRILLASSLSGTGDVHLVDAAGSVQSMGLAGNLMSLLTPTGDGRIYMRRQGGPLSGIDYVDAAGNLHGLMNQAGTAPFELVAGQSDLAGAMIYDPVTNSLFIATPDNSAACPGGATTDVNFHRVPLSVGGSQVNGAVSCAQFDVDMVSGSEDPVAFAYGPGGSLLLVVDTNSSFLQCRMLQIDPQTLVATPYACNGDYIAGATSAGTFAPTRGQAVVLDTFSDNLRAFDGGEMGEGTVLPVAGVSNPGSSGDEATLITIGPIPAQFGLTTGTTQLSIAIPGSQTLNIDAGSAKAGAFYWVLGSATGWCPGFEIAGTHFGLVFDAYTNFTLFHPNSGILPGSFGVLDPSGKANMSLSLPGSLDPTLAGVVLYHVASSLDPSSLLADWASNPVALELLP